MTGSDTPGVGGGLRRVLGRREVLALAFGAMIGWSWVLLTGEWLTRAGSIGAVLAFVVGGAAVLLISLTYAELAAAMPEAGGEHVYTHRALGLGRSFVATWALMMAYVAVPVFEAVAVPTAMEYLIPGLRQGLLWEVQGAPVHLGFALTGVLATVLVTVVNLLGIRLAAVVQSGVTAVFLLVGLAFIVGALANGDSAHLAPTLPNGLGGALGVLIMVPALMVGFDVIPQSAEEIRLPARAIGTTLVLSVAMAVAWYVLITLGVALALPPEVRATSSMGTGDAMAAAWGSPLAGKLLVAAGVGALLTSWNAFIIGGSRVMLAMARSGLLPPVFARVHPRWGTPWAAILLIGGLSAVAPFFGRTVLVWLIDAGSFAIVIAYVFVAWAFLRLRRTEPDLPRPYRVRHGKVVGSAALVLALGLATLYLPGSPAALLWPQEWLLVLVWALAGAVLWWLAPARRNARG